MTGAEAHGLTVSYRHRPNRRTSVDYDCLSLFLPNRKMANLTAKTLIGTAVGTIAIVACVSASGATAGAYVDISPTWAPKGGLIAFSRGRLSIAETDTGLYVVDSNGGEPRRIVAGDARWPSWSPDGDVIAYATEAYTGSIQRVRLDGSGRRRLSAKLQGYMSHPQWSPDGKRIAFHRTVHRRSAGQWRRYGEIWIVNPDGTRLRRIAANAPFAAGGTEPVPFAWSPRSDRLVYSGVQNGVRDLWTVRIDGRRQRLFRSRLFESAPVWSPDGKQIAFTGKETDQPRMYVLTLAGRRLMVVGSGLRPQWDASSQRLAFIGTSAGVGVYVTTVGTGTVQKLLASDRGSGVPVWAPDGNALVVSAYGDCASPQIGIYVLRAGAATRITNPCTG